MGKSSLETFSLIDFLAYLFPGIALLLGLVALLANISSADVFYRVLDISLAEGVAGLAVSYILGVVSSAVVLLFRLKGNSRDCESLIDNEYLRPVSADLRIAFVAMFGDQQVWSTNQFYAVRAAVRAVDPKYAALGERQNSLRQIRKNSMLPTVIWGMAGTVWALKHLEGWHVYLLSVAPVAVAILIAIALNKAANRNRAFEVRDYGLGFLVLYRTGRLLSPRP